ncbi:MAG: ferritin-like domain-containing protein [Bacteriovoracaceae bacterium]|jgi:rubrerythrin|nr:ferritin-like domain-containing protein [Bacteriovoracaceae bacterium]
MNAKKWLRLKGIESIWSSAEGASLLLSVMADGETACNGEVDILGPISEYIGPGPLQNMVYAHIEDEHRHSDMILGHLKSIGMSPRYVQDELRYAKAFSRELEIFQRGIQDDEDLAIMALIVMVFEERAISEYELLLVSRVIPEEFKEIIQEIIRDEKRHLGYCLRLANSYVSDSLLLNMLLSKIRTLEAKVFSRYNMETLRVFTSRDCMGKGRWHRVWKFLASSSRTTFGLPDYTRFFHTSFDDLGKISR